jgi:arylsulfatase A-like enzyme
MSRHNVLFLVIDSLRADKFHEAVERSHLAVARLIREHGVRFDQFYSVASTTTPCFGSILTGLYPTRNGLRVHRGDKLGRDVRTLGQHLQKAGYRTAAHVTGPLGPETDLQRGFDEYDFRDRHDTVYTAFGSRMRRRIRGLQKTAQPWFEFLHFWILHRTRRYSLLYRQSMGSETGWWQNALSYADGVLSRLVQERDMERTYERSLDCMFFYLDLLLREVDLQRTIVILMGDHGEHIGAAHDKYPAHNLFPGNRDHAFHAYEFLVRIPFVLLVPQRAQGLRVTDPASQVDIVPTLLGLIGGPEPRCQGRNLGPLFAGGTLPECPVFFEAVGGKDFQAEKLIAGVRSGRWKFIHAPHSLGFRPELFDLESDPHEERNVALDHPDIEARMRALLTSHYEEKLAADAQVKMSAEEERIVTERLKDLGYLD